MSQVTVARLVIECSSPMAVSTGGRDTGFDTQLVRDVNGLPLIPATSVVGVWRHLAESQFDTNTVEYWFGSQSQRSALTVSDAVCHDSNNQPMLGLAEPQHIQTDSVLRLLAQSQPLYRERVRINDRGSAAENAKFDQVMLPAGTRFSLYVKAPIAAEEQDEWQRLLSLWQDRKMAFGSATRNGLGRIKVVACEVSDFDLTQGPAQALAVRDCLNGPVPTECELPELEQSSVKTLVDLELKADDVWRCGRGTALLTDQPYEHSIAAVTYSEPRLQWQQNQVIIKEKQPVLCGSSVKGILAHRMLYHLNRLNGVFADQLSPDELLVKAQRHGELANLLGFSDNDMAQAGYLYVEDTIVNGEQLQVRHHNHIDRFTGGVRNSALFAEELLYQPSFRLTVNIDKNYPLSETLQQAVNETIYDLKQGLLAIAGGTSRGGGLTTVIADHSEHGAQA